MDVLSGLVALYSQLEEIEPDEIASDGLTAVETALDDLVDSVPTISEGIEMGHAALNELEEHIPILEDSRQWLDDRHLAGPARWKLGRKQAVRRSIDEYRLAHQS